MSLIDEIKDARKVVVTDGYEMSIGELISLYKQSELVIDPVFQRLFRWDDERKTRFIESIILGIPVPPIFVYQDDDGVWELIDGLQRVSTILQFTGDLRGAVADELGPLVLNGTKLLPGLSGKKWTETPGADDGIGSALQIELKRSRLRVEILKSDDSGSAKFELFQRLNTGGANLSEQEVRNCVAVSLNRAFFDWLLNLSNDANFILCTDQTESALKAQAGVELVLRFLAFLNFPYDNKADVHEYLDDALLSLATNQGFDYGAEEQRFRQTFAYLAVALGAKAFKRWDGGDFSGKFLMSVYEVLATGVAKNIDALSAMGLDDRLKFLRDRATNLWANPDFTKNSGAGVRGTTRLARLLPIAADCLKP